MQINCAVGEALDSDNSVRLATASQQRDFAVLPVGGLRLMVTREAPSVCSLVHAKREAFAELLWASVIRSGAPRVHLAIWKSAIVPVRCPVN